MNSKNLKLFSIVILLLSIFSIGVFALHSLSPSSAPNTTFHSLNDIYTLITTGATSTPSSSLSTSTSPTSTSSHSTSEIYALLANMKTADTAVSIPSSLTPSNSAGTAQGYTLGDIYVLATTTARIGSPTLAGTHTFGITPASTMYTLDDIYQVLVDLKSRVLSNHSEVKSGSNYFGIVGSYIAGVGNSCNVDEECNTGQFCDVNWSMSCQVIGEQWYPCASDLDCTQGAGLFCGGSGACTAGTDGLGCMDGTDCNSGVCGNDYVCSSGETGSSCDVNYGNCASGFICDINYTNLCVVYGEIGSPCGSDADCNAPNTCGINAMICAYNGSLGAPCNAAGPNTCNPGLYCGQNECSNGQVGDYCGNNAGCESGYCDSWGTSQCTDGGYGAGCSDNSECSPSNYCDTPTNICLSGDYGTDCGSSLECDPGLWCEANWACVDGRLGDSCEVTGQCAPGLTCGAGLTCN